MGCNLRALSVRLYSARMGTSKYTERTTRPSSSGALSVLESIALEISRMFLAVHCNGLFPLAEREPRMGSFHFPPMLTNAPCSAQDLEQGQLCASDI